MALAKNRTFYNLFGFTNVYFQRFLDTYRNQLLIEHNKDLNIEFHKLTGIYYARFKNVAQFVLDNCMKDELNAFIKKFTKYITLVFFKKKKQAFAPR